MTVFETALLVLTILMSVSIVWYTLILGISPMPSTKPARQAMLQLSVDTGSGPIYELGSGWGHLLIPLARQYPTRKIIGYELSLLPWLVTLILKRVLGLNNIQVRRQNFLKADLTNASVILCYLFPEGMEKLQSKLQLRLKSGSLEYLISNNFSLPLYKPVKIITLNDLYQSPVYLYKLKANGKSL